MLIIWFWHCYNKNYCTTERDKEEAQKKTQIKSTSVIYFHPRLSAEKSFSQHLPGYADVGPAPSMPGVVAAHAPAGQCRERWDHKVEYL